MATVTITQAQLDPIVAAYLAAHPPQQVITQAQVTAGVSTYLAAHPPAGGLTVAQVQALIDASIAKIGTVTPPPPPPPPPTGTGAPPAGTCPTPTGTVTGAAGWDAAPLVTVDTWDNFDGPANSKPDNRLWQCETTGQGWQGGIQWYDPSQCYLDGNGHLVLEAIKRADGTYLSGSVTSRLKWNLKYGHVAASIKFPSGVGYFPAFWMLSNLWPAGGEIDMMEFAGPCTTATATVHPDNHNNGVQKGFVSTWPDLGADFHTYWCDWHPGSVTLGLDDHTLGIVTPATFPAATEFGCDTDMHLNLNFAIQGWLGGPNASTPFPAKMLIDWVYYTPS